MIYIKEGSSYLKYYVSKDSKFMCMTKNGDESIILYDISDEFDAVPEENGDVHFVLQGTDGELIYLKKENGTWKKYSLFKSRNGIRGITCLQLLKSKEGLCAFYIMEHMSKNLLVKHTFSTDNMFEEPEVIDVIGGRKDFCICTNPQKEAEIFFKNENSEIKSLTFDGHFRKKSSDVYPLDKALFSLKAVYLRGELCFLYMIPKNEGASLIFCKGDTLEEKNITFGLSRNSRPQIFTKEGLIIIQWSESLNIIECFSKDGGQSFSKPVAIGSTCIMAKIKYPDDSMCFDKCAVYNFMPYMHCIAHASKLNMKEDKPTMNTYKPDITNDAYLKDIVKVLKQIEDDITAMGKTLDEMCSFMDRLTEFKNNIYKENASSFDKPSPTPPAGDIGEIDEENIKLFETTDIDAVLPDISIKQEIDI